jgi:Lutheran blood group glycoprotein
MERRSQSGVGHQVPSTTVPPACRCSPLGAVSAQCHENSTCVCRPGFVGYKCDRCHDNFFLTADSTHCQECPTCYTLVKEQVSCPAWA